MGVGTADADADARSTRAKLEADTHEMGCESQRRRERLGVSMLNSPGRSACRRVVKAGFAGQLDIQMVMVMLYI